MFPAILIQAVIVLVIVGLILWGINQFPLDPTIAKLIRVIVIVFVAIWLLYLLMGLAGYSGGFSFPRR